METTLINISSPNYPPLSPPSSANLRRPHHLCYLRNVPDQAQFSMPLIDLTLRRITTANPLSLNNHIITSICPKIMADELKKTDIQPRNAETTTKTFDVGESKDEKQKGSENPPPPSIPPPPEKPLPGDCCGSGCVRCVWDVYYEELEEYDRLCKAT